MTSQPASARAPQSRREVLINWLALAVLLGLGVLAAHDPAGALPGTPPVAGAP